MCESESRLRGEVGLRSNPGEGVPVYQLAPMLADRAPRPNPLRASFARLDPAKSGARENFDLEAPALTGPPVAVHARRDDRATRPVFLHVGRGAASYRIRSGIVARIDVGLPLILPVDRHAAERPPALSRRIGDGWFGCLRGADP